MNKTVAGLNRIGLIVGGMLVLTGWGAADGQVPGSPHIRFQITDAGFTGGATGNRWNQDEAANSADAGQSNNQNKDQKKETSLLDSLPEADLHAGIAPNSMQRAVTKREIADPNLSFAGSATPAPMYYGYGNQQYWKTWDSPNLRYRPLYFEEEGLERYGHHVGPHLQPYVSGLHFMSNVFMLPYKMTVQHPYDCEYGLGYYRPGNCNPAYTNGFYPSGRGGAVQGLVIGGLLAL